MGIEGAGVRGGIGAVVPRWREGEGGLFLSGFCVLFSVRKERR